MMCIYGAIDDLYHIEYTLDLRKLKQKWGVGRYSVVRPLARVRYEKH